MTSLNYMLLVLFLFVVVVNRLHCQTNNIIDDNEDPIASLGLIFPGTKWCGPGNKSESKDDLGKNRELDMCCREHDLCPNVIHAMDTKYNLKNDAFHTRLSCECDEKFRKCLRAIDHTIDGWVVGHLYFNQLGSKCFRKDYPVVKCLEQRDEFFITKCLLYQYDSSGEMIYQWFDVEEF